MAVYLKGRLKRGVGPHDVALALVKAVFKNGFVKNKVMEFVGPGIKTLSMDFRNGIDVMTTETTCLSSIWETDGKVEEYLACHGRKEAFKELHPEEGASLRRGHHGRSERSGADDRPALSPQQRLHDTRI